MLSKVGETQKESDAERRRVPRLFLSREQFKLDSNQKVFSVSDLSIEGFSLRILESDDLLELTLGKEISGILNLGGAKHAVRARVRNVRKEVVGCEFESLQAAAKKAIEVFLDPVELGKEMRPMTGFETSGLWYNGARGTDFLIWRHMDGTFKRFLLCMFGSFIQWEEESGLQTGKIVPGQEPAEIHGLVQIESLVLNPDPVPNPQKLRIGRVLIESAPVSSEVKQHCLRRLESAAVRSL